MQRHLLWKLKRMMIAVVGALALAPAASALPISGLFDTGVDGAGAALPTGSSELHYAPTEASAALVVLDRPAWVAPPAGSRWIGPASGVSAAALGYTLSFDLTGLDAASAEITGQFSARNPAEIYLNGISTGIGISNLGQNLHAFQIDAGFVQGVNTLEFRVQNPSQWLPTGLLVADLAGSASSAAPVPEPTTGLLLGLGLAGIAGARSRRS